jgi:hypothetical protein
MLKVGCCGDLTKPGVQHIQGHLIALSGPSNCNQSLVAVVLWFVYLDDTTAELPDLIDLRSALANDCTNHVIWNENLLGQRLARHDALHRLDRRTSVRLGTNMASLLRLLRTYATVAGNGWRAAIVHWYGSRLLLRDLALSIRMSIGIAWCGLPTVRAPVVIWVAIVSASWLGHVWNHLHSSRHYSRRATASRGVRRCRGSSKPLRELLKEGASDIVGGNMNGISNAEDDEGTFCRKRKA